MVRYVFDYIENDKPIRMEMVRIPQSFAVAIRDALNAQPGITDVKLTKWSEVREGTI